MHESDSSLIQTLQYRMRHLDILAYVHMCRNIRQDGLVLPVRETHYHINFGTVGYAAGTSCMRGGSALTGLSRRAAANILMAAMRRLLISTVKRATSPFAFASVSATLLLPFWVLHVWFTIDVGAVWPACGTIIPPLLRSGMGIRFHCFPACANDCGEHPAHVQRAHALPQHMLCTNNSFFADNFDKSRFQARIHNTRYKTPWFCLARRVWNAQVGCA